MYTELFTEFEASSDTLRVYEGENLVYSSEEERLLPLLGYIAEYGDSPRPVVVFDKVMGNAAALLAIKAGCSEVFSPLGSEPATESLEKYGVQYTINELIPFILQDNGVDICPMERLSLGKDPEEFYRAMLERINPQE